jgi:four helix bundle protein
MTSTDYKELTAWQRSMDLVREVYRSTRSFPREELFGLSSQMRRAAVSVPSNIAEGKGRYSRKELIQFLYKARGSLMELETQIIIARDLDYLNEGAGQTLSTRTLEVTRILNGLINHFQQELQT